MKNKTIKHCTITRILTALLVFVITFTPVFDKVIPPNVVKALGGDNATAEISLVANDEIYTEDGISYIKILDSYLAPQNIYSCGNTVSLNVTVNGTVGGKQIDTHDIKYLKCSNTENINNYVKETDVAYVDEITDAQVGEWILIYVKPLSVLNAYNETELLGDYGYTLMGMYHINSIDDILNVGWYSSAGEIIVSEYSTSAVLSAGISSDKIIAGKIKYIIKKVGERQPAPSEWESAAETQISVAEEGRYVGYVGIFADDISSIKETAKIAIDINQPNVLKSTLQRIDNNGNWVDESNIVYLDEDNYDLTSFRYAVYVNDDAGIEKSGLDKVYMYVDDVAYEMQPENDIYIINVSDDIVNAGKLQIVAHDKAGNESDKIDVGHQVKLINKELNVSVEVWNGEQKVAETLDFPYDKVVKPYTIKCKVTSGYEIDAKITIDGNEITREFIGGQDSYNEGIYAYDFTYIVPSDVSSDAIVGNVKIAVVSGVYSDIKESDSGFVYDASSPVISDACLQYYDDASSEWKIVTEGIDAQNTYYINPNTDERNYRYCMKVQDATSEVAYVNAYTDSGCTVGEMAFNSVGNGEYIYPIDTSSIPLDGLQLYIKTGDTMNNDNLTEGKGFCLVPNIKSANGGIKLELISVKDDAGNKIDLTQNKYYNKPIKVALRASSGYRISEIYIDGTQYSKMFTDTDIGNDVADSVTKRYQVDCEFVIPAGSNQELTDMIAYAVDCGKDGIDDVQTSSPVTIGDLFYDATKPNAVISVNSTGWTNSPKVVYTISSGASVIESSISYASYSISGSVADSQNNELAVNESGIVTGILNSVIKESADVTGTNIIFNATDIAGNTLSGNNVVNIKYDKSKPTIDSVLASEISLMDNEPHLKGNVPISVSISDNLTLESIIVWVTDPNNNRYILHQSVYNEEKKGIIKTVNTSLRAYDGTTILDDGKYTIEIHSKDMAQNEATVVKKSFILDNKVPIVDVKVSSGVFGGKMPKKNYDNTDYDYYIKSNVGLTFSCNDDNIDSIVVTDNGDVIYPQWNITETGVLQQAVYYINTDGRHTIRINATDKSGNQAQEKSIEFVRDTQKPTVSILIDGTTNYTNDMGELEFRNNPTLELFVSDMCVDNNDINVQINKSIPGNAKVSGQYLNTSTKTFSFAEEADYEFNVFARDKANNKSDIKTVKFRLDKTAPELSITGISDNGTSDKATTVTFRMKEVFWQDAEGTVNIYRKAGDGHREVLLKTIDYEPRAFETNISEALTETGTYRLEFNAADKIGHSSSVSRTFTIDKDAPVITLKGVNNYDITDNDVELFAEIKDDFYNSKKIRISGTKTDINGYTSAVSFSGVDPSAALSVIRQTFSEDGIYDIQISCDDFVGNTSTTSVHFTIDKTKPIFGDLSKYDGTVLTAFEWDIDLDKLVTDLTVCDVHMYLNGREYDGVSELEDGSYTLRITAEDEMGHYTERNVSFVIDTKKPVFIVTGVEDGEVRNDDYSISISLQLEEDILEFVELNGKNVIVTNNEAKINISDKGKYTIIMQAKDKAGNITNERIRFEYGEEESLSVGKIIPICITIVLFAILFIILMRSRRYRNSL